MFQRFLIIFYQCDSDLNIAKYDSKSVNIDHIEDAITRSKEQHKNHPSIIAIKSKSTNKYFTFNSISKPEIEKEISNVNIEFARKSCSTSWSNDIFILLF